MLYNNNNYYYYNRIYIAPYGRNFRGISQLNAASQKNGNTKKVVWLEFVKMCEY